MLTEADLLSMGFFHGEKIKIMKEVNQVKQYSSASKLPQQSFKTPTAIAGKLTSELSVFPI